MYTIHCPEDQIERALIVLAQETERHGNPTPDRVTVHPMRAGDDGKFAPHGNARERRITDRILSEGGVTRRTRRRRSRG